MKKWYLYVIECSDGSYYTGITNDVERRIEQHNEGKASKYTRVRRPVTILAKQCCKDKSEALRKEYALKQLTKEEKKQYILNNGKKRSRKISKRISDPSKIYLS